MPFTVSHVAAALPFLQTPLLPAAVVVGTMAPDIPYYVPVFVPRDFSHGLVGAVTIDPAIALVSVLLWWFVLREPIIDLLPRAIGVRIPTMTRTGWRPRTWSALRIAGALLLSLLVGIATHLLWDSFTHPGWLVDHVALLRTMIGPLPLDKWLQHASSVAGLVIIAIWSVQRPRRTPPDLDRPSRLSARTRAIGEGVFVVAGIGSGLAVWFHGIASGSPALDPDLVFLVARVGIGVAGATAIVLVVLWLTIGRSRSVRPASGSTLTP